MLSAHKSLLLLAVVAAVASSTLTLFLAAAVQFGWLQPEALRPFFGLVLALICIAFISAVTLGAEYAQALRGAKFQLFAEEYLSGEQLLGMLRWCPAPISFVALLLALTAAALLFAGGGTHNWTSAEPLTLQVARGSMLFQAIFAFMALPVVISGYRVPGSFSDHVGPSR